MPRFVLLAHDHPWPHLDLMLEDGPALRTWRLESDPEAGPTVAEPLPAHRPAYLDYEGPVSGGRGTVVRRDAGTFAWLADDPDRVVVALAGGRLAGTLTLMRSPDGSWSALLTPPPLPGCR